MGEDDCIQAVLVLQPIEQFNILGAIDFGEINVYK